jgi:DNA-directed RNA polymerase
LRKRLNNAKQLQNYPMKRKQIKRNCLTWAYSSRKYGFAKQLQKDWMDELSRDVRRKKIPEHPFERRGFSVSHYAAEINEQAISSVVQSAAGGMKFFQSLADIMAAEGLHMKFVTPLGFPMFQYYRTETGTRRQKIWLFDRETRLIDKKNATASFRGYTEAVKRNKSSNAISPNIIHAMDATHLMLTVLTCQDHGINDLMVIHDSFSTTIGNASMMRDILRLAFVELYTNYCLYTDLMNQCKARHPDPDSVEWPEVPPKGHLDLKLVLESDYFFT